MEKRYAQVAQQLACSISNGEYPVGSTLPNEPSLAENMGVSRSTVRAALAELQKLGLVSRRPGSGTRVESAQAVTRRDGFSQTLSTVDAIVQYALGTRRDNLKTVRITADRPLAAKIGADPGSRWLRISYRRIDKNRVEAPPICWTDVFVADLYAEYVESKLPSYPGAIAELVEEASGRPIAQVEQTLRACGVPETVAEKIEAPVDGHALEITRRYYFGSGALSLVSVSVHPGDRFSYVSRLTRT